MDLCTAQAKICEEWVAWTTAMAAFFSLLALFGPERLFELASIAALILAVLTIVALWFKAYFDRKGKGKFFPDTRTATSGLLYSTPIDIIELRSPELAYKYK
ncbi:hypothetical protein P3T76_006732 [Phytophthora citrophthora]|uniref:Uncharacterized protein n=1 Tax=Phytophthora citrophthora TaxID=4793 RepID=A0AAD9GNY0_9STRA|nr:hypothetical protein P3T76_006732 [Phytophthora citrophthora]